MRKFYLIFLAFPFVFSCSSKNALPEEILPRKKMQDVMWDMIRTGEFLNDFVFSKDTTVDKIAESQKWYNKVYTINKISKKDFDRSYTYYQEHPVLMKELLDSLSKKQVQLRQEQYSKNFSAATDTLKRNALPPEQVKKRLLDTINKRKKIVKKDIKVQ